jgi:hypothetical protein
MPEEILERVARLPQNDSVWMTTARRARAWIHPKGKTPYRPFMIMVMDASADLIRLGKIVADAPTAEVILENLTYAMRNPAAGSGKRVRPSRVLIDDPEMVRALSGPLSSIGVSCDYEASFPMIDFALRDLERVSRGGDDRPGLLAIPGVTPAFLEELFSAAAFFHGRAPWRRVDNLMPIEVRFPADGQAGYIIILGYGGEEFGLAYYPTLRDLRIQLSDVDPKRSFEHVTAASLTFSEAQTLTFDDLDAIERYRWPVISPTAYLLLIKMTPPGDKIGVPDADEIKLLAAALRVLPDFVSRHMRADEGGPRPAAATFSLPAVHGGAEIALCFPVDVLGTDN